MKLWKSRKRSPWYLTLGFGTGFFSSVCGVGGGCILMPFLVNLFRLDIKKASGTSLATIIPIVTVGSAVHLLVSNGNTDIRAGLFLAFFCIAGSCIGSRFLLRFKKRSLKFALSLFLIVAGLKLVGLISLDIVPRTPATPSVILTAMSLAGLIIGVLSILLGVGCGLLLVPLLLWCGLGIHSAVATSLFIMISITLTGAVLHQRLRLIDTKATKVLIPGAVAGAITGAFISHSLSAPDLKLSFGAFMILASLKMLTEVFLADFRPITFFIPIKKVREWLRCSCMEE